MNVSDYWCEAVACSFDEHGIKASREQIAAVARDMENARDTMGQAFYVPEDPRDGEAERLKKELQYERDKITCRACKGTGEDIHAVGTSHVSISRCDKCRGQGRHSSRLS
jgi:hypothetical protein